jgi:predicted transcriptional regulator
VLSSRSNSLLDWSEIQILSEPVAGQNFNSVYSGVASIAVEGDNVYVVWTDYNNTNNAGPDADIFYRHFNGNIWTDIQVISEPVFGQNFSNIESKMPDIAVENGKVYVVWVSANDTDGCGWLEDDIFFRCNLTGSDWEDIQVISEPVHGQNFNIGSSDWPSIEVDNGKIHVIWRDENNTNGCGGGLDREIFYRCNLTGSSWEKVQVISEPVFGQNINKGLSYDGALAVENNKIYVTWTDESNINGAGTDFDIFYRANLTGNSWEDIQIISEPVPGQNLNTAPSTGSNIAVENGIVYLVWGDSSNTNGAGTDSDVFYRVNLTGTSWQPVQVISEPVPGMNINTGNSGGPDIEVKMGNIYLVWGDNNNTNGAGIDGDISYRCNLTGNSWEPVQVISEPIQGQNNNIGISGGFEIALSNKLHVIWQDDNNTNGSSTDQDIFYRCKSVILPSLLLSSPNTKPVVGNTSTEFNFTITYHQLNNAPPTRIKVIIDGIEYSMFEVDPLDINYTNGKKYYYKMKNFDIGTHTYEFNASDGINFTNTRLSRNFYIINTAPQIINENNLTVLEDQFYTITYEFKDIDITNVDQDFHWEFATNASWLNFNLTTGELKGTPGNEEVGEYWVYIAINDTIEIVDTNFTLTVVDVNDNPIILTKNVEIANEDELYEVDYDATDIDSPLNKQIWSIKTSATSWLNISSENGILNGTPTNDDVGEYWINLTVNDTEGGSNFTNFTLTVLNVNDDPEIISNNRILTGSDELYSFQYNATDIDSPSLKLSWSLKTNATWLSIDPNTGVLSGTPTRADAGSFLVNVTVSDGDGGFDWDEFIITVYLSNLPPQITTEDIKTAIVNVTYIVDYNATDDRSIDLLEWSFSTNASWLNLETSSGNLSGTPKTFHGGKQFWVNISVHDTQKCFDYHNFTLTAQKEPKIIMKNNVPKLMNFKLIPAEGDTDTEFTFSVKYFDLDDDEPVIIQVVIDNNAFDMKLEPGEIIFNGVYEYRTKLTTGKHTYYFSASDGLFFNNSDSFTTQYIIEADKQEDNITNDESLNSLLIIVVSPIIIILIIFSYIGGTEVGKYKFLTICFVPLYNRLHPENVLNNYTRGQIHGFIKAKPGENYAAIKKALDLNNGTLAHHAKVLEKEGYIYSQHDGFRTRFYPKGIKKPEPDTLKQNLIDIIRQQPKISQREIISLIDSDSSQQVISYNLIKLTRDGTIRLEHNGRENRYSINYDETDSYPDGHQDLVQIQDSTQSPPIIQPQQDQGVITSRQTLPQLPPSESGPIQDTQQSSELESSNEDVPELDDQLITN